MKLKFNFFVFFVINVLLFSTCDFLNGDDNNENNNNGNGNNTGVEPLLQTQWGQGNPYNSMLPMNGDTRPAADCSVTAMTQIMKFHRHPVRGSGQSEPYQMSETYLQPSVNFEVDYDWDNMINSYTTANPGTQIERDAIALLTYHYGISRGMNYMSGGSVSGTPSVILALTTFFGYDKNIQHLYRTWYDDEIWATIIKEQLDLGLPVYYYGRNQTRTSSHLFVIDGYDNTGKFHINWGWYGSLDGYYSLNSLSPGNNDWNYDQFIIINIKPDEGGVGSNVMTLRSFTAEKISVFQNESFTVTAQIRSAGFFSGGQAGVALVNNNGNIEGIIGMNNFNSLNPESWRTSTINCSVPNTIAKGQYKLRIVTRPTDGEWKIVTLSEIGDGVLSAIDFMVK